MTDIEIRIEALEGRLDRVAEVLERAHDDVTALKLLLYAAVRAHPDARTLIAALDAEREKFMAAALGKSVSEQLLARVDECVRQAIALARTETPAAATTATPEH